MELRGRRVLITGGSRGIGEAIAREVARRGAVPALVARDAVAINSLADELGGTAHPADLADPDVVGDLFGRVEDEAGPVDVVVNNAGLDAIGHFADKKPDEVEAIYRVNLMAPVELSRQAVARWTEHGTGHLVNISSIAGSTAFPGMALYASTKAGLSHFTHVLELDLKGTRIGTTLVELGPVPSDMLSHVNAHGPTERSFGRAYLLRLTRDVDRVVVAAAVADAIERGRRRVRLPRRTSPFASVAELPQRATRLVLLGIRGR